MSLRFRLFVLLIAGALAAPMPALAQVSSVQDVPSAPRADGMPNEPPKEIPKPQRGDREKNLSGLFSALKGATDETTAKAIESRIWAIWLTSNSDTANLLMSRVRTAAEANDHALALRLLDSIIEIKPDFAEAWNRRATIRFMRKEYDGALADIRQVLAREPRHFGALSGLGMILQEFGDEKNALDAFRRAIAINPQMKRIPDLIKKLTETVEGRDI